MKGIFFLFSILIADRLDAQQAFVTGNLVDEKGNLLSYVSVAVLDPQDSTLVFFTTTDEKGHFEIAAKSQKYLLQCALLGYETISKEISLVSGENSTGVLLMKKVPVVLGNVEVTGERIPVLIKKDTVEYDAQSFKTKPDAVAEDLLKKLPGVQVDRAGNIKAGGEDVNQVLVDGKPFFGSDPKVATKNLPADAIKKVQVFDKKSDESELTGIDDGNRDKTINLLLKDNQKSAYFGDVEAGGATGNHYESDARLFRFTKKSQIAALAMINNINRFGFTFRDYLDFNGGIGSLMSGSGKITLGDDEFNLPVDFGKPVTGLMTSGAGGLNYSNERKKQNRFNISYLGDGVDKNLDQKIFSKNYSSLQPFMTDEVRAEYSTLFNHRLNLSWEVKPDSSSKLTIKGGSQLNSISGSGNDMAQNFFTDSLLNSLSGSTQNINHSLSSNASITYLKKWESRWRLMKLNADISMRKGLSKTSWNNILSLVNDQFINNQFQNNESGWLKYGINSSVMRKVGSKFYLVPELYLASNTEWLSRKQGIPPGEENIIDSLNAEFMSSYYFLRPGIGFRKSTKKKQLIISAFVESGRMSNGFSRMIAMERYTNYILPKVLWAYQYKTGSRVEAIYESAVNEPNVNQLMPLINNINPLIIYSGNRFLFPEYEHSLHFTSTQFDQFSFTSFFTSLTATYTHDKISWSRKIDSNLQQVITPVNVSNDYKARAHLEFSTPLRGLGVNFSIKGDESLNRALSFINDFQNVNINFEHGLSITIDNRRKEKCDVSIGAAVKINNTRYSIAGVMNNDYYNFSCFSDITYTPDARWIFIFRADLTQYYANSFHQSISIPLLSTEFTRYFFKNNRVSATISSFDLLNKNTGIERISELNYLQQIQSNIINRYFMLSLKFRLNKFDNDQGGLDIKINKN